MSYDPDTHFPDGTPRHHCPDCPKPTAHLIGENGNVFNLIGIASKALKRAGQADKAKEMTERCFDCGSYDEALTIIQEYVNVE
jgi:hypothetical protein